jgi:hypothetical protein
LENLCVLADRSVKGKLNQDQCTAQGVEFTKESQWMSWILGEWSATLPLPHYGRVARDPPIFAVLSGLASFLRGARTLVFPSLLLDPVTSPLPNNARFVSTTD